MTKQPILSIVTFFLIAFCLTFAFSKLPSTNFYSVDIKDILCGFGPLISGLICYRLFKTETTFSIGGTQPTKAWFIVIISAITFMATNSKSSIGINSLFVLTQLIYCFGEEFGWRHYLQNATNKMNKWIQFFVIGFVWFCWHFSWLQDPIKSIMGKNMNAPIAAIIISVILALSIASFILGFVINKTQSILLPTILHFAVKTNLPTISVAVTLTLIAIFTWNKFILGQKKITNKIYGS